MLTLDQLRYKCIQKKTELRNIETERKNFEQKMSIKKREITIKENKIYALKNNIDDIRNEINRLQNEINRLIYKPAANNELAELNRKKETNEVDLRSKDIKLVGIEIDLNYDKRQLEARNQQVQNLSRTIMNLMFEINELEKEIRRLESSGAIDYSKKSFRR